MEESESAISRRKMLSSLVFCSCLVALLTIGSASVDPYRNAVQQVDQHSTPYSALLALLLAGNSELASAESLYHRARYPQQGIYNINRQLIKLSVQNHDAVTSL